MKPSLFKLTIEKIGSYIVYPVQSFIFNIGYWIIHIKDLKNALDEKKKLTRRVNNIQSLREELSKFEWEEEKIDWRPWVITILNNDYRDDCDGAAVLGKFLFEKCLNKSAYFCYLRREDGGHIVTITNDHQYMISNKRCHKFQNTYGKKFEQEILEKALKNKIYDYCYPLKG